MGKSKSKVIYRDVSSNRLITRQQAVKRDPETWVEEVFSPDTSEQDDHVQRKHMPSVKHLTP
jgi:hypothetical protein